MATPINKNIITNEVSEILVSKSTHPLHRVWGTIHLIEKKIDIDSIKVLNLDIVRDYDTHYSDDVTISVVFPIGTYADIIYPAKENIEFSVTTRGIKVEAGGSKGHKLSNVTQRYKAKILNGENPRAQVTDDGRHSTDGLDVSQFVIIDIQLVELCVQWFRLVECGTVIRRATVKEALETLLTHQLRNIDLPADKKIFGIDLIDPDNQEKQEQIVIPHGTKLADIPDYIQKKQCGIYKTDICSYVQNRCWYIFPRNDLTRQPKGSRQLTIVCIPPNILPSIDNSWRTFGDNWVALCTGVLNLKNQADATQLNSGTGMRFSSAITPLTEGYPSRSGNKAILDKGSLNTEETSNSLKSSETYAPYRKSLFTANELKEYSFVSGLNTALLTCKWENSYPRLIEPGMMITVLYMDANGQAFKLKGTILKAHHSTYLKGKGLTSETYVTNSGLGILVENDLEVSRPVKETKGGAKGWMHGAGAGGGPIGDLSLKIKDILGDG